MHRTSFGQLYQNGGRSPYAAYARDPAGRSVSELYDYVDEQHNVLSPRAYGVPVFEEEDAPDVIHVTYLGDSLKFEFPPFSIAEEKVQVYHVRDRLAQRLNMSGQQGRLKLLYKDRELKRDDDPLRKYGCKQNSEIHAIVTSEARDYSGRRSGSDSDSYASSARRSGEHRRDRAYSTHRGREPDMRGSYVPSNGYLHPQHHTPPNGTTPPRGPSPSRHAQPAPTSSSNAPTSTPRPSAPAVQKPQADPSTGLGKIQAISYEFHTEWAPQIERFIRSPPNDRDDRIKEYRKLSEIAYKKVFERGDAIEPDGSDKEEIRNTRKKLYADAQALLKELDKYKPRE